MARKLAGHFLVRTGEGSRVTFRQCHRNRVGTGIGNIRAGIFCASSWFVRRRRRFFFFAVVSSSTSRKSSQSGDNLRLDELLAFIPFAVGTPGVAGAIHQAATCFSCLAAERFLLLFFAKQFGLRFHGQARRTVPLAGKRRLLLERPIFGCVPGAWTAIQRILARMMTAFEIPRDCPKVGSRGGNHAEGPRQVSEAGRKAPGTGTTMLRSFAELGAAGIGFLGGETHLDLT